MTKNHKSVRWRRIFVCCLFLLSISMTLSAQDLLVSGEVTDGNLPISGANVIIKNTTNGVVTDFDGRYSITAQPTDTLQISYLGYTTLTIPVQGRTNINITLQEDIEQLAAVEITGGYYSIAERTKTGNVTKIDTDQLQQQVIHSPMESLQGRVAGLEVQTRTGLSGQAPLVTLRGQTSLRGSLETQPLYIIDGVPIDNRGISSLSSIYDNAVGIDPLATLDPSLIESIEILKDADATAIYGSRGANGVIIINTKRGQAGKTKYELQVETGVSWVGKFMKLMNTNEYLEMRREAFENDGVIPTPTKAPDLLLWDQNRYTDWQKELIGGNAEFQKYQATISGGTDQTSFLLSGGFQKEGTVFPGDFGFLNNNLLANINHRSQDKRLQFNTSINYGYHKSNLFNAGLFVSNGIGLAPNAPVLFDKNGNINWELDEFGNPTFSNPLRGLANPNINRMQSLQWNGNISYNILRGLTAKINIGFNHLKQNDKHLVYKKNINPLQASIAHPTTNQRLRNREHILIEPQIHYNLKYDKHIVSGLLGSTFQKNENSEKYLRGEGYLSESQVGNIALAERQSILIDEFIEYRYAALFGRIGYSYADKYHLNLTGRRDGSSRFGEKSRFANFGAIGTAWDFYKETSIQESLPWLNSGKLRGSYGTTGSDHIGDYRYRDTYSNIYTYPNSLSLGGLIPRKLHNPFYQWEKNTKLEFALDIGLWEDRILLASSWYKEQSGNQLIGLSLPSITGFSSVQGNFPATVENSGWEFVLQTIPVQTSNFVWNSNLNFTLPKNRLVDFPDLESSSYASRYVIGKSIGIRKLYHYSGIDPDTGKYTFEDTNGDGLINHEDQTLIVDLSRKFYGGWHNSFEYKNWNFSFLFEFVNQKGTDPITAFFTPGGQMNMPREVLNRWQKNDPSGEYQAFTQNYDGGFYNYTSSDANIADASFIRMKSLSLNYRLSAESLVKSHVQHAHIYVNAQNIFTISPYKGFDAQSPGGLNIPALTSFHLGIKLTL